MAPGPGPWPFPTRLSVSARGLTPGASAAAGAADVYIRRRCQLPAGSKTCGQVAYKNGSKGTAQPV